MNRKAISGVFAVLLMIAVAVAASLVTYAWVMTYLATVLPEPPEPVLTLFGERVFYPAQKMFDDPTALYYSGIFQEYTLVFKYFAGNT